MEVQPKSTGARRTRRASAGKDRTPEEIPQPQGSTDPQPAPGSGGLLEAERGRSPPGGAGDPDAGRLVDAPAPKAAALKR